MADIAYTVNIGSALCRLAAKASRGLVGVLRVSDHRSHWLSGAERDRAVNKGLVFLSACGALAAAAMRRRQPLWNLRPKWHCFAHQVHRLHQDWGV